MLSRLGFDNVLVRLETAEGAIGWGEASGGSGAPVEVVRILMEGTRQFVPGAPVFEMERIRTAIIAGAPARGTSADWRIWRWPDSIWRAGTRRGSSTGRPIHALLGGAVRNEINFYGYPLGN